MATENKPDVDWDALDDTESDDDNESGSDSESGESNGANNEEEKKIEREYEDVRKHKGQSHHKYDDYRGPKPRQQNLSQGDPNGNYEQFYKNDPDFFVGVIKKESAPHEFSIKLTKDGQYAPDFSKSDIRDLMAEFDVSDPEILIAYSDSIRVNFFINDSEQAVKVYSNLYDKLYKRVKGYYKSKVFYQRDIETLEKYADEAAEEYYKKQQEKPTQEKSYEKSYEKGYEKRYDKDYDKGYDKGFDKGFSKHKSYDQKQGRRKDNHHTDKRRRDDETHSKKEDDVVSTNSLSGFGQSSAPKFFFNKNKSEVDTKTLKDVTKSAPADESNNHIKSPETNGQASRVPIKENDVKNENLKTKEQAEPSKSDKEIADIKDPELNRRGTDNEFEVKEMGSTKSIDKNESHTLVNKVDAKLEDDNEENKGDSSSVIQPRHQTRGSGRGLRRPMQDHYSQISRHIGGNSHLSQSTTEPASHKDKPTFISDRPETDKFEKQAAHQNLSFSTTEGERYHRGGERGRG